jgi:hypothetical protein
MLKAVIRCCLVNKLKGEEEASEDRAESLLEVGV